MIDAQVETEMTPDAAPAPSFESPPIDYRDLVDPATRDLIERRRSGAVRRRG